MCSRYSMAMCKINIKDVFSLQKLGHDSKVFCLFVVFKHAI